MYRLTISLAIIVVGTCGAIDSKETRYKEGHIDFYPNGGDNQPDCVEQRGKSLKSDSNATCRKGKGLLEDALVEAQSLACEAFTESILEVREYDVALNYADVEFHTYDNEDDDDYDYLYDIVDDILPNWFELHSLLDDDDSTKSIDFDKDIDRLAVIIHGYMGDPESDWIQELIEALFEWKNDNMNVVVVDWFKSYNYYVAAEAVEEVAEATYKALKKLATHYDKLIKNKTILKKPYLHIIGHSLGAHIAGLTAKKLKDGAGWNVDRITAFDPAKPFFKKEGKNSYFENYRLDKSYAKFVDVIHTNGHPTNPTFGFYEPLGHIDFYPNGGDYQPGCKGDRGERPNKRTAKSRNSKKSKSKPLKKPKRSKKPIVLCSETGVSSCLQNLGGNVACLASEHLAKRKNMVCDHSKAQDYFTRSLKGTKYFAVKFNEIKNVLHEEPKCYAGNNCENCAEMGINAERYKGIREGSYFVNTTCGKK